MSAQPTKNSIEDLLSAGAHAEALADLHEFWAQSATIANAGFVLGAVSKLAHLTPRCSAKIAILRSFTIEPAVPLMRAGAALLGIDLEVRVGEFNSYARDLLDPAGFLAAFDPQIVFVAVQSVDLLPDIWRRGAELSAEEASAQCDGRLADMRGYLRSFRERSAANVVLQNMEMPAMPAAGVLDSQFGAVQSAAIARFNDGLRRMAAETIGVSVMDYDGLVARAGRLRWHDEQKWLTARMPIAAECLPHLAREYLRFVCPLVGRTAKVAVCDLDNTLWGGVIGEDGMNGIRLGAEYPGAAYRELQRALLDLHARGVLLAVASKNNDADAREAIDDHPGMLLRSRHFSAMRVNWNDKAQSLREIASELNIGLDALVFVDDNPVERRRIRVELPQVHTIDLPGDPMLYAGALRSCPLFERVSISAEDKERARYYAAQQGRTALQEGAGSLEEFYRSLEQVVEIAVADDASLARVAQLTQKTNQFNLTTHRYSEPQIAAMMADPAVDVYCVTVRDRFGDNGIVAVAILRRSGADCEIDTFLMSCRVIARTVETAIVAELVRRLRGSGVNEIWGWFVPTAKNMAAASFYRDHGFRQFEPSVSAAAPDSSAWRLAKCDPAPAAPDWIDVR